MEAEVREDRLQARERALRGAAERAYAYLREVEDRRVAPGKAAVEALQGFREPFPEGPADPAGVVTLLAQLAGPATVATTGRRYFGFVIGGALPASLAASWMVSAWDQNTALHAMSPAAAELEEVALEWVCEALGLPKESEGGLVTCATTANFTALVTARQALLGRMGWSVADDGMFGAPPIQVVVGQEVHASVLKALRLAGFGSKRVTVVEADNQGRMRPDKLPRLDQNAIVCIQAGNVNSGSFDPAREICLRAHEQNAWVHVDGAFGLWAAASPRYQHLLEGFDLADSWAVDAHKWPNINYDCGIVLVRDGMAMRSAMAISAAYLQPGLRREPMHHVPEASRRARGVELWAGLKSLGRSGLANLIERTCAHAQRFAAGLQEAGFEILNDVVVNQVLVSFGSREKTLEVIRRVQEDGTCWCGGTVWQGKTAMRISVSSWATTREDVDESLRAMVRMAREAGG
jgi:glutamate/tyrosine decarboxylase-like PLP-dependent enzyme